MIKKGLKKAFCTIFSVIATSCLVVGGGLFALVEAKAESVSAQATNLVSLDSATASIATHKGSIVNGSTAYYAYGSSTANKYSVNYTGLTVSSDTPYSGAFEGVFNGDTTINYKFPGTSTDSTKVGREIFKMYKDSSHSEYAFNIGDGDGDFYFTVTSTSNPAHKFTYKMSPTERDAAGAVASTSGKFANARQWVECVNESGTKVLSTCRNDQNATLYKMTGSVSNFKDKTAHFDYFNNSEHATPIYFKFYKNANNYWAVNAYFYRGNAGKWFQYQNDFAIFDGSNMPAWDFSDGYTIEFGSNYATGSDICFTAINGTSLSSGTFDSELSGKSEILYPNERVEDGIHYIDLTVGEEIKKFSLKKYGTAFGSSITNIIAKTEEFICADLSSAKTGITELAVSYGGQTKNYVVTVSPETETAKPTDTISTDNATVSFSTHTSTATNGGTYYTSGSAIVLPEVNYSGVTVSSDKAYKGALNGVFTGNTTIDYKFPGTSLDANKARTNFQAYTDSSSSTYAFNLSDGDGDFYFKVTSVSNPNHTFTYKMSPTGRDIAGSGASTSGKFANARQWVQVVNDSGKTVYSTISNSTKKLVTDTVMEGNGVGLRSNVAHFDYFNSSENSNPIYFKFYKNSTGYWAVNVYYSKGSAKDWYSNKMDIAVFNGSGNMPTWDFSDGYTIEFGSNYKTGSDVCFTSVNGWSFSTDAIKDCTASLDISYNGKTNDDGNIYLPKGQSLDSFTEYKNIWYVENWAKSMEENVYIPDEVKDSSNWASGSYSPTLTFDKFKEYPFEKQYSIVVEQPYTICLIENGGEEISDIVYSANTLQYKTLENPVRWGWEFKGWFKDSGFTQPITELSLELGNCTLYAKWWEGVPPVIENNGKPYLETVALGSTILLSGSDVYASDSACGVIPDSQIKIYVKLVDATDYTEYNSNYTFSVGKYSVKYVASDTSGNTAEYIRVLNVVASKPPVITLSGEIDPNGIVGKEIQLPTASAGDYSVTRTIVVNGDVMDLEGNSLTPTVSGEYNIVYYAENEDGLPYQLFYSITVLADTVAPEFVLTKTDYVVLRNTVIVLEELVALDNVDGEVVCSIVVTFGTQVINLTNGQFTATDFGSYTITYSVMDSVGNSSAKSYNIQVVEKIVEDNESGNNDNDGDFNNNGLFSPILTFFNNLWIRFLELFNLANGSGCSGTTVVGVGPLALLTIYLLKKKGGPKNK